jgi:hypothetical protein
MRITQLIDQVESPDGDSIRSSAGAELRGLESDG